MTSLPINLIVSQTVYVHTQMVTVEGCPLIYYFVLKALNLVLEPVTDTHTHTHTHTHACTHTHIHAHTNTHGRRKQCGRGSLSHPTFFATKIMNIN